MTLHLESIQGRTTWWVWVIRNLAGVVVEQSTMQFRSAQAAQAHGRARLMALEERGGRDGPS
jgi:hypothetical protein